MIRLNPNNIFYAYQIVGNSDGTIELTTEANDGYESVDDALQCAKDVAEQGLNVYVYKCMPIYKCVRARARVIKLKERK